jgi:hypothetical protein
VLCSWLPLGGRLRAESVVIDTGLPSGPLAADGPPARWQAGDPHTDVTAVADDTCSAEKMRAVVGNAALSTRVYLVAGPTQVVVPDEGTLFVPPVAGPGEDRVNVVVHIETDAEGTVARPLDAHGRPALDLRTRFPALYPLTVRRLSTWARDASL